MTYIAAFAGLAVLVVLWGTMRTLRRRRRKFLKQERLSSAFNRSHAVRSHGHGAVGISQNLLIAQLTASTSPSRRAVIGGDRRAA
jgi:hypothetical protein